MSTSPVQPRQRKASCPSRIVPGKDGSQDGDRPTTFISPDALALVRFGLRAPDDPRIVNTLRAIDALLSVDCAGPLLVSLQRHGYGEHKDGSAFDGTGMAAPGRCWRASAAHFALAGEHVDEAKACSRSWRIPPPAKAACCPNKSG